MADKKRYEVRGRLSVDFVVHVDAESEDEAEKLALEMDYDDYIGGETWTDVDVDDVDEVTDE